MEYSLESVMYQTLQNINLFTVENEGDGQERGFVKSMVKEMNSIMMFDMAISKLSEKWKSPLLLFNTT